MQHGQKRNPKSAAPSIQQRFSDAEMIKLSSGGKRSQFHAWQKLEKNSKKEKNAKARAKQQPKGTGPPAEPRTSGAFGTRLKAAEETDAPRLTESAKVRGERQHNLVFETKKGPFNETQQNRITPAAALLLNRSYTVPVLGRGFPEHGKKAHAIALFKAKGGIKKADPNESNTDRLKRVQKSNQSASVAGSRTALKANGSVATSSVRASTAPGFSSKVGSKVGSKAGSKAGSKQKSALAEAFGGRSIDVDSTRGQMLLKKESRNKDAFHEEEKDNFNKKWEGQLEVEKMHKKMDEVKEKKVTCYKCFDCPKITFKKEDYCIQKQHRLERVQVKQRWFTCQKCSFRRYTLGEKMPAGACKRCGGAYKRGTMAHTQRDAGKTDLQVTLPEFRSDLNSHGKV